MSTQQVEEKGTGKSFAVPLLALPQGAGTRFALGKFVTRAQLVGNRALQAVSDAKGVPSSASSSSSSSASASAANSGLVENVRAANDRLQALTTATTDGLTNDELEAHAAAIEEALAAVFIAANVLPDQAIEVVREVRAKSGSARDHAVGEGLDQLDRIDTWLRYTTLARNFNRDPDGRGLLVDYTDSHSVAQDAAFAAIFAVSLPIGAYQLYKESAATLKNHAQVLLDKLGITDLSAIGEQQLASLNGALQDTARDGTAFAELTAKGLTPRFDLVFNRRGKLRLCLVFDESPAQNKARAEAEVAAKDKVEREKQELAKKDNAHRFGSWLWSVCKYVFSGLKSIWDAFWDIAVFGGIYYWFVIMTYSLHSGSLGPGIPGNWFLSIVLPYVIPFLVISNLIVMRIINNSTNNPESRGYDFLQEFNEWYYEPNSNGRSWNATFFEITPRDSALQVLAKAVAKLVALLLYPLIIFQWAWFRLRHHKPRNTPTSTLQIGQAANTGTIVQVPGADAGAPAPAASQSATLSPPGGLGDMSFMVLRQVLLDQVAKQAKTAVEDAGHRTNLKRRVEHAQNQMSGQTVPKNVTSITSVQLNAAQGQVEEPEHASPRLRRQQMLSSRANVRRVGVTAFFKSLLAFTLLEIDVWWWGDMGMDRFGVTWLFNDGHISSLTSLYVGITIMLLSASFGLYRGWQAHRQNQEYAKLEHNPELEGLHEQIETAKEHRAKLQAQMKVLVDAWNANLSQLERVKRFFSFSWRGRVIGFPSAWMYAEDFEGRLEERVPAYNQTQFWRNPARTGPDKYSTPILTLLAYAAFAVCALQALILTIRFGTIKFTGVMAWNVTTVSLTQFVIAILAIVPLLAAIRIYFQFYKGRTDGETNFMLTHPANSVHAAKHQLKNLLLANAALEERVMLLWRGGKGDLTRPHELNPEMHKMEGAQGKSDSKGGPPVGLAAISDVLRSSVSASDPLSRSSLSTTDNPSSPSSPLSASVKGSSSLGLEAGHWSTHRRGDHELVVGDRDEVVHPAALPTPMPVYGEVQGE